MRTERFELRSEMPSSVEELWSFHCRSDALETLSPPGTRVVDRGRGVEDGSVVRLSVGFGPFARPWIAVHSDVRRPSGFADTALDSPFAYWTHHHVFSPAGEDRSVLRDTIHYVPPAWLPRVIGRPLCQLALALLFRWRHWKTRRALISSRALKQDSCGSTIPTLGGLG